MARGNHHITDKDSRDYAEGRKMALQRVPERTWEDTQLRRKVILIPAAEPYPWTDSPMFPSNKAVQVGPPWRGPARDDGFGLLMESLFVYLVLRSSSGT